MPANDKAAILETVMQAILVGNIENASEITRRDYPFVRPELSIRKYTPLEMTQIFVRDGFRDRYSGQRLIFPPVLRLISMLLPKEFPFQRNWKMDECHVAYWELFPTVDHLFPIARGGTDNESNWITTSMLRNSAKANWTIEELGWQLLPPADINDWDGLMKFFLRFAEEHPELLREKYFKTWSTAALASRKDKP